MPTIFFYPKSFLNYNIHNNLNYFWSKSGKKQAESLIFLLAFYSEV